jgi:curved DNA-binding protein CbpA
MINFHSFWLILEATSTYAVSPEEAMGLLKLALGYTGEQLNQAYRKAALDSHPDKGGDPIMFKKIQAAYETLKDRPQNASPNQGRQQAQPSPGRQTTQGNSAPGANQNRYAHQTGTDTSRQEETLTIPPMPPNASRHQCEMWHMDTSQYTLGALGHNRRHGLSYYEVKQKIIKIMENELARTSAMTNPDRNAPERKKWLEEVLKRYKRR